LKILVTVFCLWYVSTRIDTGAAVKAISGANALWLAGALVLYVISKIVAALRLHINFRNIGLPLPADENFALYWLGMFYNLFLPGSISGDAYKVILLTRRYGASWRRLTAAVLLDRFSGLAGLAILLAIFGLLALNDNGLILLFAATALAGTGVLFFVIHRWMPDFKAGFFPTLFLGILVQLLQVMAVYALLLALGIDPTLHAYVFIFLLSSVASVLPLTIGGLGLREIVFLYASSYFLLDPETSVVISLLFFLLTVLASVPGIYFVFRDPLSQKNFPQ
jgi:uncharacterized membrane protein YbhN (UPF0104 family)